VGDLSARLAGLSPARQRLLARRAAARGLALPTVETPPVAVSEQTGPPGGDPKGEQRRFYDRLNRGLDATIFGQHSLFLNYGCAASGATSAASRAPAGFALQRNSVRLVLETVGEADLGGRRVLDVGCGRGGTVRVLATLFQPRAVVGLDLSAAAVGFCRREHPLRGASFCQGDAERLPFADRTFDAVTNIESAHAYPERQRFYGEVGRVLRVGGSFFFADIFPAEGLPADLAALEEVGLALEHDRDITPHVLASCDQQTADHVTAFGPVQPRAVLDEFLALPGSPIYRSMQDGALSYRILRLRRRAGSGRP
jgi:phthiocerol/phenolphthiocerol synthesis type-I polyketide synthase E